MFDVSPLIAMTDSAAQKKAAAVAALAYLPTSGIVGVGTGSTVNFFIEALAPYATKIKAAVSSSEESSRRLKKLGIEVVSLNEVDELPVYIDGADEITAHGTMIKGGGAALTREKIIASVAKRFICIADQSKLVPVLGEFPLPIEVIPMARSAVARALLAIGGRPKYRTGVVTDNGNVILDWHGLSIVNPKELEARLNQIVGVVSVGLFAARGADVLLLGETNGVRTLTF